MCFDLSKADLLRKRKGILHPKKAKKDIIVYKVISIDGYGRYNNLRDKKGNIMTWVPGYQYTELDKVGIDSHSIYGGMLHSKKTLEGACGLKYDGEHIIVKMIIPKGTDYYENNYEYVSKSLIYPHQNEI